MKYNKVSLVISGIRSYANHKLLCGYYFENVGQLKAQTEQIKKNNQLSNLTDRIINIYTKL